MSKAYYTLQVDRCGPEHHPGKWRLTVTQCVSQESAVTEQRLHFSWLFDSYEEAVQYGGTWASLQRLPVIHAAAITHLRWSFQCSGFDVSAYSDDQVSKALVEAAKMQPSGDLFGRAFQRLGGSTGSLG